ncbi:nuclear transport factor 2 family protein [Streptomyces sp. NPDC019224]|uniref:nuclear transport factor 2 family protein n=1 Tax=Streptomyces sp. NPDC019224 TaxID=3154484 RepID=UPI0034025521
MSRLIDRYIVLLDIQDENGFDSSWPSTIFTEDVRMHFPIGTVKGIEKVAEFHHAAKVRFDRTLHVGASHDIALAGDTARVRMHVVATHVHAPLPGQADRIGPLFDIGGYYSGEAVRTRNGWRLREWGFRLVWADGPGPDGTPVM